MTTGLNYNKALEVVKNGKMYIPASSHYPHMKNCNVACDYCQTSRLSTCLGYTDIDLCLKCVQRISETESNKQEQHTMSMKGLLDKSVHGSSDSSMFVTTNMEQDSVVKKKIKTSPFIATTNMMQSSVTYMRQDSVTSRPKQLLPIPQSAFSGVGESMSFSEIPGFGCSLLGGDIKNPKTPDKPKPAVKHTQGGFQQFLKNFDESNPTKHPKSLSRMMQNSVRRNQ